MISEGLKLVIHGVTDVGRNREHNEDAIAWDSRTGLALLADGMGGHNAGEVASALAVDSVRTSLAEVVTPEIVASGIVQFGDALRDAVDFANQEIHEQSHERPECAGMGTTLVATLFINHSVIFAHVGDSRIYRYRGNELQQVTSDHSLVQEMIDNGYLSQEEAQLSTSRNLITRALGIGEAVEVDICEDSTQIGDIYLLCSDGLSDMISDQDIALILFKHSGDIETAARNLVDLANEKGGSDNISVILAAVYRAYTEDTVIDDSTTLEIDRGE
ncbi:MAG: Stp1/IreP family PP2C-type Ser/Thr phosphatase [Gammaproteobacteria bacterium]|nr:Stp1/IreP family PP2C-type Ser/Thr phosphatase [Gammaproteobacteria bacterium]MDH5650908.1 Stp1/IreP family PP2C-type Ser/Thr phosphatase [Gammaproteobacteria bacterium]